MKTKEHRTEQLIRKYDIKEASGMDNTKELQEMVNIICEGVTEQQIEEWANEDITFIENTLQEPLSPFSAGQIEQALRVTQKYINDMKQRLEKHNICIADLEHMIAALHSLAFVCNKESESVPLINELLPSDEENNLTINREDFSYDPRSNRSRRRYSTTIARLAIILRSNTICS